MDKLSVEPVSFVLGILTCLIVGGILAAVIADRRHRCHCGRRTKKRCKLFGLSGNSPFATKFFWSYIFRPCNGGEHATVTIKVVTLTPEEMSRKPANEFVWSDEETTRLCKLAHVQNPAVMTSRPNVITRLLVPDC